MQILIKLKGILSPNLIEYSKPKSERCKICFYDTGTCIYVHTSKKVFVLAHSVYEAKYRKHVILKLKKNIFFILVSKKYIKIRWVSHACISHTKIFSFYIKPKFIDRP